MYNEPKKIVHFLNSFKVGGIESVVIELCNQLTLKGHEVFLIVLSREPIIKPFFVDKEVKVIYLNLNVYTIPGILKSWFFGSIKISKTIKRINPDIIHLHSYFQIFAFICFSIRLSNFKGKVFRTIHTSGIFYENNRFIDKCRLFLEKLTIASFPISLIAISSTILQNNFRFFNLTESTNRLIYNGISMKKFSLPINRCDLRKDLDVKDSDQVVIYVSRFVPGKNHLRLLKDWVDVKENNDSLKLWLLGDGPLKNEAIQYAKRLKIFDSIKFIGEVENVSNYLLSADIGIFPSDFEGFPISLIEKLAAGLPTITSDIDIFNEIIQSGVNGIIIKLSIQSSIGDAILKLANDKLLQKRLKENAHKLALNFTIEKMTNQTLDYYNNV